MTRDDYARVDENVGRRWAPAGWSLFGVGLGFFFVAPGIVAVLALIVIGYSLSLGGL